MRYFLYAILACLSLVANAKLHAQARQTVVKTLVLSADVQHLDLSKLPAHHFEARTWERDRVQIQLEITSPQFDETLVKHLISSGRYRLEVQALAQQGRAQLSLPELQKVVWTKGQQFQESINILVYLPKHFSLDQPQTPSDSSL